ncbi:alpha/beta hydrolase [Nocardia jiangxiensis]|uniref:prolyl aminopeptidase n=1 Tax=Nocardia jiangxiensis TaxID=282685 RepID=A0ABW6S957_9NOCA
MTLSSTPRTSSADLGTVPTSIPPIAPYADGLLEVGEGNQVYWCTSDNPAGRPALVVHGGPGSGSSPGPRKSFDPNVFRIVQFDQRGCGRSIWELAKVWPDARLHVIDNSGHTGSPAMGAALARAIARFA